jgi:hypothetical protein
MTTTGEGAVLLTGERLAAASRACGAPILEHQQPGLVDEQIDALTAPLGLTAPAEARASWGSHDGVPFPLPPRPGPAKSWGRDSCTSRSPAPWSERCRSARSRSESHGETTRLI